jgi:hypothetical protein
MFRRVVLVLAATPSTTITASGLRPHQPCRSTLKRYHHHYIDEESLVYDTIVVYNKIMTKHACIDVIVFKVGGPNVRYRTKTSYDKVSVSFTSVI